MSSLLGIFLIQALPSAADVSHAVAIDPEHTLLLIGGRKMNYPSMGEYGMNIVGLGPGESLRLAISEKTGRTWDLGDPSLGLGALFSARVTRVDRNSVVIERNVDSDYAGQTSLKFFFDLAARKVLKVIALDNPTASVVRVQAIENRVCASVKTSETAFVSCGDEASQTIDVQLGPSGNVPDPVSHPLSDSYRSPISEPLPQSTYDQFARARPQRVRTATTGIRPSTSGWVVTRLLASASGLERRSMTARGPLVLVVSVISTHVRNSSQYFRFQNSWIGPYPRCLWRAMPSGQVW